MKKMISVIMACVFLLSVLPVSSLAANGSLLVNGEAFSGSLSEAIVAAGNGGTVTVIGTVRTHPVGKQDSVRITDVTIEGEGNAKLLPSSGYVSSVDDNLDILTIKGNNVTVRNLLIDAGWVVDFPLNLFGCSNVTVENVTVQHGKRGGINIMTGGHALFKNVTARNSLQAGFFFESCGDAGNVSFENCFTSGNWYRSGVMICNAYGSTTNVDASGITCSEGYFSVHDRTESSLHGKQRQIITYSAAPKNADGKSIDTSMAMNYPLEKSYLCLRFGVSEAECKSSVSYVDTDAYGFSTRVFFDNADDAAAFIHEGENVVMDSSIFSFILVWILRIFNSLRINPV